MLLPAGGRRYSEFWGRKEEREVFLSGTVCSNHCADESRKSRELGISESRLLTGFYGELSKPGELASSESLWG